MVQSASSLSGWLYQNAVKPVFFSFPADLVHETLVSGGEIMGSLPIVPSIFRTFWAYSDPLLEQEIAGIHFSNPLGLAAGFDYNAQLTGIVPDLGFGWHSVGTMTHGAYGGNKPPMLGRLPLSRSLWVNKGFKNPGVGAIVAKLGDRQFRIPTGVSVGSTNKDYASIASQLTEYEFAFTALENSVMKHDYYELNISCPNLAAGTDFTQPKNLPKLLKLIDSLRLTRPVFVKMPIDIENRDFLRLVDSIAEHKLAGIIVGNLTKNRNNPRLFRSEAMRFEKGGFSGKPTFRLSNEKIQLAYKHAGKKLAIVGTGGIFSASDAYYKIRCGASLLQLITGMIYQGPQVVGQINSGLSELLKRDGFTNVSEAIGVE